MTAQPYHHGDLHTALLDAAEAILEREGIAALTLRAAAREAGVSHAAPAHHFRSLAGLLSALAARGFTRFAAQMQAEAARAPDARLTGLSRGYVGFARASPGLFALMFRSEQLDWSLPALSEAGAAAFALLLQAGADGRSPLAGLVAAAAQWSLVHGLATLLIDGRLAGMAERVLPGADMAAVVEGVLASQLGPADA